MSDKRRGDIATIASMNEMGFGPRSRRGGDVPSLSPVSDYDLTSEKKAPPPSAASPEQKSEEKDRLAGERAAQQYQAKRQSLIKQQAQKAGKATSQALGSVRNGLDGLSMPGGMAAPLFILVVLLLVLVKNNGKTRLQWLWLVLTGNAALPNVVEGSGDFGPGSGNGGGSNGGSNGGGSGGGFSLPGSFSFSLGSQPVDTSGPAGNKSATPPPGSQSPFIPAYVPLTLEDF